MILILYIVDIDVEYKHRGLSKTQIYRQVYEFIDKCRMLVGMLKY